MDLPFEENASTARARATGQRLATSSLPIYVTGEPGTGRRTLARRLAETRAAGSEVFELGAGGGPLPTQVGARIVLVQHMDLLDAASQIRIAAWCASGTRVTAWGAASFLDSAHPELRAHIGNGAVELPPLRERGADAAAWARLFLARHAPRALPLSPEVERAIASHPWPGNLAQLEGTVVRALALRAGDATGALTIDDLGISAESTNDDMLPLSDAVERFRREYILKMVERCGGNRTRAAKALQVDPRTVFRCLEETKRDDR